MARLGCGCLKRDVDSDNERSPCISSQGSELGRRRYARLSTRWSSLTVCCRSTPSAAVRGDWIWAAVSTWFAGQARARSLLAPWRSVVRSTASWISIRRVVYKQPNVARVGQVIGRIRIERNLDFVKIDAREFELRPVYGRPRWCHQLAYCCASP